VSARERILLFCIARRALTWEKAGVLGETPIDMIERGLIVDRPFDRLALTVRPGGGEGHAARSCERCGGSLVARAREG
jgi:hypothetical protein